MVRLYGAKAFKEQLKGAIRDLRPAWVLNELNLPYERIALDPVKGENKTPEYLKLNPTGKVPTLVDGDFVLFESAAICEYLAEKHGRLIPKPGTNENYKCRQWNYWVATNVEPLCGRIFGADFFLDPGATTDEIRKMAVESLPRFTTTLNTMLAQQNFIMGSEFMLPDIFLTCALYTLRHTPIIRDYPNLLRHYETCMARPAFQKALSQNGL